jgi:DNA polymerase III subunit beta
MQFLVLQENLQKALSSVGKNVTVKTQLPVLGNILLETEEGRLKISSTNLESSVTYWVGASVDNDGAITVPARLITELVSTFRHDKIEFSLDGEVLKLKSGDSEATLSGIAASEFPPLPKVGKNKVASLKKEYLEKNLPLVLISASLDEGRPILTGIRLGKNKDKLIMAATDGYRLSVKQLPVLFDFEDSLVIPAKAFSEVYKAMIDTKAPNVDFCFSEDKNQIIFFLPDIQIATRLIEGEYPAYEKIIPPTFTTRVILEKEDFLRAIKFAAVYARESANIIKIKIGDEKIIVSANTPQIGENRSSVAGKIEGSGGEVAFNVRFLLDLLNVYEEDEIAFEMTGPLSPGVFKNPQDESFLHIIMPVRVQG